MAGEALSKTASATSLTIAFHKKCDKEWRKLRDKLEAQFQEDIGRLYAKSLYWDLEVVVNCKTIRAHHSILQVRAPKFFSHLCAISDPSSPNSRYSSAALEKASVDYLESFIRNIYIKNSIEEEENSVLKYLDSILLGLRKYDSGFGDSEKNDSILSPESDVYVTPKASPSEIIEQFGLVRKDNPPSHGNGDKLNHTTTFLPLDKTVKDSDYFKGFKSPDFGSTEDSIFNSSLSAKSPISDREAQASYYSIVPLDDVCREERPRHLDLKGRGFAPAFNNSAGEALERELAEQDELLKSFQSILSKEEGKTERSKFSAKRSIPVARGSPRLGIPVRDTSRSKDSVDRTSRPSREVTRRDVNRAVGARSKEATVSRLPVRKQSKKVNLPAAKNTSEKYIPGPSHSELHLPITEQESSVSHNLNHKKDPKANISLDLKPKNLKPESVLNHQNGTGSEMDGVNDYNEELGRQYPSKISPCFCEAEEDEEEFLCSACSPCSPDMEGGVSSSQLDSGLDTGTSGSGGNPPPGGGITAGDPTPSDATSATTSSSWHCLHSVSSPLLPRDPSVPHLLSPSFVSMTTEGNGEPLAMIPGAECNSIAIGEDDTEAAVLSKLKSSSVSVSSGAVSDTDDVGMMEYDETDIRCDNLTSVKHAASTIEDMNRSKEPISFSESMTKSIEVYQTYDSLPQKGSEIVLPEQEYLATHAEVLHTKLINGIDTLSEDGATVTTWKVDNDQVDQSQNVCSSQVLKMNNNSNEVSQLDNLRSSELQENATDTMVNHNLLLNGRDENKIEDIQLNIHKENIHTPPSCDDVGVVEATNSDKCIVNGENIETKSDEIQIHSDLSSFEIISTESSGENTMKTTQHYFIDAASLLDENEFVPSVEAVQLESQKSPSKLSFNESSTSPSKEECSVKHNLSNQPITSVDIIDELDVIEVLAPPVEDERKDIINERNNEVSPVDKSEDNDVQLLTSEAVEDSNNEVHVQPCTSKVVEDISKEFLPEDNSQSISAIDLKINECHGVDHQRGATSSNGIKPAEDSPISDDRKITVVETFEQEILVSQTCNENAPEQKRRSAISPVSGEIKIQGFEQEASNKPNGSVPKKADHPQLVNFQEVSTEVCTTVQFTTLSPTEDVNRSVNFGTMTRNGNVKENLAVIDGYDSKVSDDLTSPKINCLEENVVGDENELGNAGSTCETIKRSTESTDQENVEKVTKVSKKKNETVPARVGELVRGDTFELQPGEERVSWFRQEHERRQGSMLFQGLQRGASSDSVNKGDNHNTHKGLVAADEASGHANQSSHYCPTSVSHTQSLPPMLSTGMSLVEPPTPPNTLLRVKNHSQSSTAQFTTAAVDSIHKMFGEPHRTQGEIESISPIQRFNQRFKPSKEEDIQSPDSLNNDGPMESFCHDSVLINRIPAVGAPAADTVEDEEEVGTIVEKQTDEYLEKERRDDDDDRRPVVSGAMTDADVVINQSHTDSLKRQKRTESTPIVSGGASAADFAQISPSRATDSPLSRRRTEATPILSGGGPPLEESKKEAHTNGSPRCPRRWDGTPPPLSAWVVDMSDCCKGDSSSTGPSSLNSSWSPSTPEARKRHRRRRSEGMPFAVVNRGLRAVEFSEQPADEATPNSSFDSSDSRAVPKDQVEDVASSSTEEVNAEKKKPLFSMFIDIGDSCKSGSKGKEIKRPRELSSGMSVSWQGSSSHSKAMTESVESIPKSSVKPNEIEAPKSSDSSKPNSVFMYIDASQPPKPKPDLEKEVKTSEVPKEENPPQTQRERQGFFMFIEAEPTPPVLRRPFHLRDGHLTSTPPSKRHSWNQDAPNVLEGMVGQGTTIRRHKRTQSLSVVGRSSSGSNVPHLMESASGEDSDIASQSASISSVSAGPASVSVADSSLSLVEGLDSGSSTGEFKIRGPIAKQKPMIGSSPENMGSSFEGSSKCQIPEEEYEERPAEKGQPKKEVKQDASASVEVDNTHQEPAGERKLGGTETLNSPRPELQKMSGQVKELEVTIDGKKSARPLSDSQVSDIKEGADDISKKQFVKLSDLDKSTTSIDDEAAMIESCDSFGNEDMIGSGSGSRRVRPVEEMSWIESKSKQGVVSGGSRGRLLYPMGLGKGTTRSRRGRSESPGKSGSNSGASPATAHRGETGEEQPLSETASALSSMQSSVDRSALEGSTEETDMSSSLGGSRSAPCSRLGQDLLRMFLDEVNTDVTVEVEGRSVRAHKCILSSRCQYFAAMLSGGWVESAGNVISLQGFSYSAVHFALCHIYSGTSNIPETISIVELATLADMLGLEGLKEVIMYTLKVKYCHFFHKPCAVCAVGVLECLPLAAAYGLDEIYRKSLKWITKYFIRIWPSKAFAALPRELIDKCYHQHVVHMSVENILDTVMCCDKLLATLPNVRWAEPVFGITSQLLEAAVKFIADNFSGVVLSDKFQSLGKELSWNISRLEESITGAADMLSLEQACLSHINISHLLATAASPDQETHETQWSTSFVDFLKRLESRVEGRLVRGAGRVARCRSWMQLDAQVRRRIQEKACLAGLDQSSSSGSGRRRRIGGEEEDGGSSSGCGGSDDTHGSIGRRGRSRHSSLLRTNEQRPASARGSASSSIYCTIPRSASGRAKGKEAGMSADTRNKAGNSATTGSTAPSQSQAVAAATALLDSKNKPVRKERSGASVGTLANRSKSSSSSRVHQKVMEEAKLAPKKEAPASAVVARQRKKISQLDKEKSASTVVGKSTGKPGDVVENGVSRPKTWPMRIIEQSKSSRSSPQLPTASTGGVSSNTGTPEKAGSVSSRVRISSSDSSRNSSPALRPKGVLRGVKPGRTFGPTRITKKPDGVQQQTSSPGSVSQTQLVKDGTSSPRRVGGAKSVSSRPTPDSASSRASNSPVANLRRTSTVSGRAMQQAASVTPTPKRAAWSRTKASGPALVKQNSAGAVPSPPRTSTVRSGNEVAGRKVAPGSKPRTPLVERSARPFSPKAANGGSAPAGVKKKPGPVQGALIHSRNGSNVSLDKGKEETVAPTGVGERSGTFLKDEPTVLKRPENVE